MRTSFPLSRGNHKLGKDTLIMNITSAADCPAKGFCDVTKICYARKAERQYPAVLPYRRRQTEAWDSSRWSDIAKDILLRAERATAGEIKYLRFSESGDFRHQEDVNKMSKIADKLSKHGIKVYGYTARMDLNFDDVSENMTVNGSGFPVHNTFTAVPKDYELQPKEMFCAGDCRDCHACKNRNNIKVVCKYH